VCGKCDMEGRGWWLAGERKEAALARLESADRMFQTDEEISKVLPTYAKATDKVAHSNLQEVCGGSVLSLLSTMAAVSTTHNQDVSEQSLSNATYVPNAYQPVSDFAEYMCTSECVGKWVGHLDPGHWPMQK